MLTAKQWYHVMITESTGQMVWRLQKSEAAGLNGGSVVDLSCGYPFIRAVIRSDGTPCVSFAWQPDSNEPADSAFYRVWCYGISFYTTLLQGFDEIIWYCQSHYKGIEDILDMLLACRQRMEAGGPYDLASAVSTEL